MAEAYSPEREKMRLEMGESYRTLIGHFRHEIGHYYWDRLIRDDPQWLAEFRSLFGDESVDYAQSLQAHYENGAPADWQSRHISAYATSHPWEDWAESWAHYLHISDTLEMARAYNIPVHRIDATAPLDFSPGYGASPSGNSVVDDMLYEWLRLSEASERHQPLHGAARPLPLRHFRAGRPEAGLHPPPAGCEASSRQPACGRLRLAGSGLPASPRIVPPGRCVGRASVANRSSCGTGRA